MSKMKLERIKTSEIFVLTYMAENGKETKASFTKKQTNALLEAEAMIGALDDVLLEYFRSPIGDPPFSDRMQKVRNLIADADFLLRDVSSDMDMAREEFAESQRKEVQS